MEFRLPSPPSATSFGRGCSYEQLLFPGCYRETAVTLLASCGVWRKSAAGKRQIGKTLPDIPKKSTGRGGGGVCSRRPGVFPVGLRDDRVRTHGHGPASVDE